MNQPNPVSRGPVFLSYIADRSLWVDKVGKAFEPRVGDQIEGDISDPGWRRVIEAKGFTLIPVPHSANYRLSLQKPSIQVNSRR